LERRVAEFVALFAPFVKRQWIFSTEHLPRVKNEWLSETDQTRFVTDCDEMNWPLYFQDFARGLTHFVLRRYDVAHPFDKPYNRSPKFGFTYPKFMVVWAAFVAATGGAMWVRQSRHRSWKLAIWLALHVCKLVCPTLQYRIACTNLDGQRRGVPHTGGSVHSHPLTSMTVRAPRGVQAAFRVFTCESLSCSGNRLTSRSVVFGAGRQARDARNHRNIGLAGLVLCRRAEDSFKTKVIRRQ
jgi:hypothetical protein